MNNFILVVNGDTDTEWRKAFAVPESAIDDWREFNDIDEQEPLTQKAMERAAYHYIIIDGGLEACGFDFDQDGAFHIFNNGALIGGTV
jgi:hypothetical protein